VTLRWASEVSSSVYSAPLITDLFADGTKEVVVPTFVHYLESLEVRAAPLALEPRMHMHPHARTTLRVLRPLPHTRLR
jgi:hypothetical protein